MVKLRDSLPLTADGLIDVDKSVERICSDRGHLNAAEIAGVGHALEASTAGLDVRDLELAEMVAELHMDGAAVVSAICYRSVRQGRVSRQEVIEMAGEEAADIAYAVAAMATSSLLEMSNSPMLESERQDQVENVKRMLASLIDDARVAVVKLAERVLALRHAKNYEEARRRRLATEARAVFAPLAGRLGIWQLKWELEDLSLRYTHEDEYMQIARSLQGRRVEREMQVEHIVDQVRGLLRGHGIDAQVYGRAKHIYSIWRKMHKKGVAMDQVYDMRAVRVVVDSLAECYAALGIIHSTWQHIPSEFDDYIASPKENGYRSIHTAVTGDDGRGLEIQLRTHEMHEEAELGVCAHWSYKDGEPKDASYDAKMDWLRQVMEWHEELGGTERISTLLQHRVSTERIFVSTPGGHVLDLPHGATVLDLAYRVHTDLGHACCGGRVNGQIVHIATKLATGQQVEILTEDDARPSRDWAERELGYAITDRARAKIVNFFRSLSAADRVAGGQAYLARRLRALGVEPPDAAALLGIAESLQIALLAEDEIEVADAERVARLFAKLGGAECSLVAFTRACVELGDGQVPLPGFESTVVEAGRYEIVADNRDGLLHDITQLVTGLELSLTGTTGRVSNQAREAIITLDLAPGEALDTIKFVSHLEHVRGVTQVTKIAQPTDA